MALKSTVFKAQLQIADMDRALYADHALTLARHPSETDERMMMRLLAFALAVPADTDRGALEFAAGLSDTDEPDLWQKDLTGALVQWIEVGQPDDRRLAKACGRAERVRIWSYSSSTPIWWSGIENKVARLANLEVWQIDAAESQALAAMAERSMQLQVTVQEGHIYVGNGRDSVALEPRRLKEIQTRR
ncbi:MAG TPA: YaeQ family protein [Ideonella sp.]|uniref:YaeQ family protein n=1 Tax=Ideonella sp. TaxID=1929293 RepID=UPI002E364345|nr:YaeQ family protein [Ideonella sp.]HEX5686270.1 YaeQ family protein [Ideonella sp.]